MEDVDTIRQHEDDFLGSGRFVQDYKEVDNLDKNVVDHN